MVQVVFPFAWIVAGVQDSDETTIGAATVRVLDWEAPFNVAVTVTVWVLLTVVAVAWKVAVVAPTPTVTDAGTASVFALAVTATTEPPEGAAWEIVTVQVLELVPVMVAGEHCSADIRMGAATVTDAVCEEPLRVAVIV